MKLDQSIRSKICEAVDAHFHSQVDLTSELIRIPSTRGEEQVAQDFMARLFRNRGLTVDQWRIDVADIEHMRGFSPVAVSYEHAFNVVGVHRPERPMGRSLIFNGHIDVVPTGPGDRWVRPPYHPHQEDGWLYGRGSGDMKSGLIASVAALDALRNSGFRPAANVYVQSVVEEECTGNGALACIQRGYRAEAAFIPEPVTPRLVRAQVGVVWMKVRISGDPQHAGGLAGASGTNAIESALPLIAHIKSLEDNWNALKDSSPSFCDHPHPIRINIGMISGGDWVSSVPAWCEFDVRVGLYPEWSPKQVQADLEQSIGDFCRDHPRLSNNPPEISYNGFLAEGYVLPEGTAAEGTLQACHHTVFGNHLEDQAVSALTDARFFGIYGNTPALVYGPVCREPHGFNECVNLESLRKVTQTMALFTAEWCGLEEI